MADTGIPGPTARRIARVFLEQELARELSPGSGRRSAVLAFPALLNIAEGREAF